MGNHRNEIFPDEGRECVLNHTRVGMGWKLDQQVSGIFERHEVAHEFHEITVKKVFPATQQLQGNFFLIQRILKVADGRFYGVIVGLIEAFDQMRGAVHRIVSSVGK